jgi:hypothetical protein
VPTGAGGGVAARAAVRRDARLVIGPAGSTGAAGRAAAGAAVTGAVVREVARVDGQVAHARDAPTIPAVTAEAGGRGASVSAPSRGIPSRRNVAGSVAAGARSGR